MTTEVPRIGKKARFKFFAAYAFSIGLVVFLVSWLRQDAGATTQAVEAPKEVRVVPKEVIVERNTGSELAQADEILHQKLDALNKLYSGAVWQNNTTPSKEAIQLAENAFKASLDSAETKASLITDASQKQKWSALISSFKNNFYSRNALFASYAQLKTAETTVKPVVQNTQEADLLRRETGQLKQEAGQLKNTITEKDRQIASLQTRLNQKQPVVVPTNTNTNEWKTKFTQQKAQSDKLSAQVADLKRGYQTVIEDNKRLLAKIQAGKQ